FQCLLLESGQTLEWPEGTMLISLGDCWMPNIGGSPHSLKDEVVSSSWQILENHVPQKYYLKPVICNRFLRLTKKAGCPPPLPIEHLLKKHEGKIPIVRLSQERRMRSTVKEINKKGFHGSLEMQTISSLVY